MQKTKINNGIKLTFVRNYIVKNWLQNKVIGVCNKNDKRTNETKNVI